MARASIIIIPAPEWKWDAALDYYSFFLQAAGNRKVLTNSYSFLPRNPFKADETLENEFNRFLANLIDFLANLIDSESEFNRTSKTDEFYLEFGELVRNNFKFDEFRT